MCSRGACTSAVDCPPPDETSLQLGNQPSPRATSNYKWQLERPTMALEGTLGMRDEVYAMRIVERHGCGAPCVPYGAGASKGRGQTSRRRCTGDPDRAVSPACATPSLTAARMRYSRTGLSVRWSRSLRICPRGVQPRLHGCEVQCLACKRIRQVYRPPTIANNAASCRRRKILRWLCSGTL